MRCPAHGDWDASLSICPDDDGRWLLACRSGCAFDAILAKLGIEAHGFGPDADPPPTAREQALVDYRRDVPALTLLADVRPEPVRWLWPGRIPLGKLTVLDGNPGLGKSPISLDIAARVSTGRPMPDGPSGLCEPRGVVLLTCEDDLSDTVRPRLDAAGAYAARIVHLTRVGDGPPTLAHVDAIADAIAATDAKLVVLDPFMAYMPLSVNSHKNQHIRYALGPLVDLVARARTAMLIIRHLNWAAGGDPLYRGGGIIGAVRSGLILAPDPDDDRRTVLASTKANLARKAKSLTFSIAVSSEGALSIAWDETGSPHTAEGLLAVSTDSREDRSAVAEAADFLRGQLDARPVAFSVQKREAAAAGIALPTLRRAKARLRVESEKCDRLATASRGGAGGCERITFAPEGDQFPEVDRLRAGSCKTSSESGVVSEADQTCADDILRAADHHPRSCDCDEPEPEPVEGRRPSTADDDHSRGWRPVVPTSTALFDSRVEERSGSNCGWEGCLGGPLSFLLTRLRLPCTEAPSLPRRWQLRRQRPRITRSRLLQSMATSAGRMPTRSRYSATCQRPSRSRTGSRWT